MNGPEIGKTANRGCEWFVPTFGPEKFRAFIGLLFLPYTGMVLSFSVMGSMLATPLHWDRVIAILLIYLFGLGIGAHALDALGSKGVKPWGTVFGKAELWLVAVASLIIAYAVATYYIVRYVPLLLSMALCEGFFVFAYNLEWFRGRFHTDKWFAFSWGALPVLSGYIMQTNRISLEALTLAGSMAFFSLVEIKASRPYKELKSRTDVLQDSDRSLMMRYEAVLKSVTLGVLLLGGALLIWRMAGRPR